MNLMKEDNLRAILLSYVYSLTMYANYKLIELGLWAFSIKDIFPKGSFSKKRLVFFNFVLIKFCLNFNKRAGMGLGGPKFMLDFFPFLLL